MAPTAEEMEEELWEKQKRSQDRVCSKGGLTEPAAAECSRGHVEWTNEGLPSAAVPRKQLGDTFSFQEHHTNNNEV